MSSLGIIPPTHPMSELGPYAAALAAAAEEAKVAAVTKPASAKHALVFKTFELTKGAYGYVKTLPVAATLITTGEAVVEKALATLELPSLEALEAQFVVPAAEYADDKWVDDAVTSTFETYDLAKTKGFEAVDTVKSKVPFIGTPETVPEAEAAAEPEM